MAGHLAITAIISMALMTGCAGNAGNRPGPGGTGQVRPVALTPAQLQAIQGGVRQMIADPGSARFSAATAVAIAGRPGVHVCGHVRQKDSGGSYGPDLPYYLELRDKDGKPTPERGQVGSDDAKRAKITFMCRHRSEG